jgi:hypothetical protein
VSDPAPRTRLAANLASAVSSSAAAGPLARCLSALFDLDSPLRPVPCGDPDFDVYIVADIIHIEIWIGQVLPWTIL